MFELPGLTTAEFSIALRYGEDVRELTESLRVEVRPLVKVAGERLGDMSAAAYAPAPLGAHWYGFQIHPARRCLARKRSLDL